ncbi:MAG: hypothetical protein JXR51_04560 [Bacteroidales bacterium]|nr:hypothetical protein [Bacteroidales bacterium]MBN2756429.1 hypothetical protein [Bacteroidales bacterium]
MYVRSRIIVQNKTKQAQLFLLVGFNFYGHKEWSKKKIINKLWEFIHNRVTSNTMNRFKQLCEYKYGKFIEEV